MAEATLEDNETHSPVFADDALGHLLYLVPIIVLVIVPSKVGLTSAK